VKIAFMGSDPIALPALRYLHREWASSAPLVGVFTQPDRKTGRGMKVQANPVKQWAESEGIPVHQPLRIDESVFELIDREPVDLVLVMAYGKILPEAFLDRVKGGTCNLHASLLPRLRGASPIHTAVALGLPQTGVSLMRVIRKMDAGGVADAETVPILPEDTSPDVIQKLADACVPLLKRNAESLLSGTLSFSDQDETQATYCRIIDKSDAHLDFNAPARELANRVRAFTPWPGTSFRHRDQEIRICAAEAETLSMENAEPGTVRIDANGTLLIACGNGALRVRSLQRPGGQPLDSAAFLRGYDLPDNTLIESRAMRPLEASRPFPHRKRDKAAKA